MGFAETVLTFVGTVFSCSIHISTQYWTGSARFRWRTCKSRVFFFRWEVYAVAVTFNQGTLNYLVGIFMPDRYDKLDTNNKLIWTLRDIGHTLRSIFEGKSSQKRILIVLYESGTVTQSDLTQHLGIQPGSASEAAPVRWLPVWPMISRRSRTLCRSSSAAWSAHPCWCSAVCFHVPAEPAVLSGRIVRVSSYRGQQSAVCQRIPDRRTAWQSH